MKIGLLVALLLIPVAIAYTTGSRNHKDQYSPWRWPLATANVPKTIDTKVAPSLAASVASESP
jgi:hypothetical protein